MKSKAIYFLIVVFAISFLNELFTLVSYRTKSDYILFSHIGKPELYLGFLGTLLVLDALVIWFMIKPKAIAFWLAILSVVVSKIEEYIALQIALNNIDLVKQRFIERIENRGQSLNENMVDMLASPMTLYLGFSLLFAGSLLVVLVLWLKRDYFLKRSKMNYVGTNDHDQAHI